MFHLPPKEVASMISILDYMKRLGTKTKSLLAWKAEVADYIVERGVSGIWTYKKYNSGEFEIRGGDTFTFTSGYKTISLPEDLRFTIVSNSYSENYRNPLITAVGRYLGSTRTTSMIFTPSSLETNGAFTLYGRQNNTLIAGNYWVDITIKGYWK